MLQRNLPIGTYNVSLPSVSRSIHWHRQRFLQWQRFVEARTHLPLSKNKKEPSLISRPNERMEEEITKLKEIVQKTQSTLIAARAVFPLDLFPDSITIDRKKITITHRRFFSLKQTVSVQHTDVTNVQAAIGPIFGSLVITSEHFINNTQTIHYLWKRDVIAIQELIQGMITAHREGVEMDDIDNKELVKLLTNLGCSDIGERASLPHV